ncbi:interleukin 12Ba precursor [Poecilia reticulata]|uniref:Interleukin-12 subunit beta n=1 Tax=Poecilia reticulata TaxID=8081 RepID=A0A3P9Q5F6_POERE|nr:PREDICTED: interleukin-12 subunit beta [Poecilia reticulata]
MKEVHKMREPYKTERKTGEPSNLRLENKMKLFVVSILCAFLLVSSQNPTTHWTLQPNVLVLEVDGKPGQQPISCLEMPENVVTSDNTNQDIIWKKNGVEEAQRGNWYLVRLVESLGGGNYTCHSPDGTLLNYTEVLIQQKETKRRRILVKNQQQDYLKCSTQNYNGEFHCSWTWDSKRVGKAAFIKAQRMSDGQNSHCSVEPSRHQWMCSSAQSNFSCSVDDGGSGISCLDWQHCPYAEERRQVQVTVFVRTHQFLLESYSKQFYLSEIVKPDKVRISKVNKTLVEWSYPSSWNTPYSYFPLTFQISQFSRQCRKCENPCTELKHSKASILSSSDVCQFKVKQKIKVVCVRAKDALCDSEWSEWTHVRLKRGEGNRKRKQQQ